VRFRRQGSTTIYPVAVRHAGATARQARILVVEDEDAVRATIVRMLQSEGYEVLHARHGREALERLERADRPLDVVISDVVMPVMGGRELGERMAATWPELPVIWISGYPRDAAFGAGVSQDDQPFLQKPVPGDLLVETVQRVLESRLAPGLAPDLHRVAGRTTN